MSEDLMMMLILALIVLAGFGGVAYFVILKSVRLGKIRKTFQAMLDDDGYQYIPEGNPLRLQMRDRIRAFDDLMLTNISIEVKEAAFKKIDNADVYLNYYEWEKRRTFLTTRRGRKYRETEVELHLRTGVYIPIDLGVPCMIVRGRLSSGEEEKMEMKYGLPTPPEKGIPEFDVLFVCKGPSPMVVSSVLSIETQREILSFNGTYPIVEGEIKHLVIYFNEHGINVTMEKAPDVEQMKALVEFSVMLFHQLSRSAKTSQQEKKGEGEDDGIYRVPD